MGDRVIKSRRIRWEGHVARVERKRAVYRVLVVKVKQATWKTHA
jgi:acyl-coenzyme A thioesterase PaaI-like protein